MWFYLVRVRLILFGAVRSCKEKGSDLLLGLLARLLGITCVEDLLACFLTGICRPGILRTYVCIWLVLNWFDWLDGGCEWKRRGGLERGYGERCRGEGVVRGSMVKAERERAKG